MSQLQHHRVNKSARTGSYLFCYARQDVKAMWGIIYKKTTMNDISRFKKLKVITLVTFTRGYWRVPFSIDTLVANSAMQDKTLFTPVLNNSTMLVIFAKYIAIGWCNRNWTRSCEVKKSKLFFFSVLTLPLSKCKKKLKVTLFTTSNSSHF